MNNLIFIILYSNGIKKSHLFLNKIEILFLIKQKKFLLLKNEIFFSFENGCNRNIRSILNITIICYY